MDRLTEHRRVVAHGDDRVRAALASIGANARTRNLGRADTLDQALSRMESGTLTFEHQEAAVRSAHQLAGSAGTFGLQPASKLASWFEWFFTTPESVGQEDRALARARLTELRTRLDDPPDLA